MRDEEWLPSAKRLAVGMKIRVKHGRESRANMVIGNEKDRWWCYCQRCKQGGVVMKDHVLLTAPVEVSEVDLALPSDIKPVLGSEFEDTIGRFLATKGMMFPYLPKLYYSEKARRVLLKDCDGTWHGRDLTGKSPAKWLHYKSPKIVFADRETVSPVVVVTEDLFSMYKVRYATRRQLLAVCSTLGAACSVGAALTLKNYRDIIWAYDGDDAGDKGAASGMKRMRPFVNRQFRARPPDGLDPKDLSSEEIRKLIMEAK